MDTFVHARVRKEENMITLNNNQLEKITGGSVSVTGSLISAFFEGIEVFMQTGRTLGQAIRRLICQYR